MSSQIQNADPDCDVMGDSKLYPPDPDWETVSVPGSDISGYQDNQPMLYRNQQHQHRRHTSGDIKHPANYMDSQVSINSYYQQVNSRADDFAPYGNLSRDGSQANLINASQATFQSSFSQASVYKQSPLQPQHQHKYHQEHHLQQTLSPLIPQSRTAWGRFTNHVKNITSDSVQYEMKPTSDKGSKAFRDILKDVQEELNRKRARRRGLKKAINVNTAIQCLRDTGEVDIEEEGTGDINEYLDYNEEDDEFVDDNDDDEQQYEVHDGKHDHVTADEQADPTNENHRTVPCSRMDDIHAVNDANKTADIESSRQSTCLERELSNAIGTLKNPAANKTIEQEAVRQNLYDRYLFNPRPWHEGLVLYDRYKSCLEERMKQNGMDRPDSSPPMRSSSSIKRVCLPKRPHTNLSLVSHKRIM